MNELLVLIGLPSSGKSTYANKKKTEDYAVHSSDALREEMYGDESIQCDNEKLFIELHKRMIYDLRAGRNVIFDATNINYKKRMYFLEKVRRSGVHCKKVAVLFATPYEDCLKYNASRERKVPEHVIKNMYMNFTVPFIQEGFDDIQVVWNYKGDKFDVNTLFQELDSFDQETPYHTLTVGEHCRKCCNTIEIDEKVEDNRALIYAGLLHDISKPFCKIWNEKKGYFSYFQHQYVSSYDSLFYLKNNFGYSDDFTLEVAMFIVFHMNPYFWKNDSGEESFRKLVGKEFFDKIIELHRADRAAH